MRFNRLIILVILSAFIYFNCSDEPTSIGNPPNTVGVFTMNSNDDTLAVTMSSFHPENIRLGAASRILLGNINDDINASILIKYIISLPDSIKEVVLNDSINVIESIMEFTRVYSYGDGDLDFEVYKVNSNWSVSFNVDSLPSLVYDESTDLKQSKDVNDSLTTITLSTMGNQVVKEWLDVTADTSLDGNYGVYIVPTTMDKVLGYQAITSAFENIPNVKVVIEKLGGAWRDTLTLTSSADITIMKGSLPDVGTDNVVIRGGYVYNAKLFFDLSKVPENVSINKAELVLTSDSLFTKIGSGGTNSLQAYFLFDSTNVDSISGSSVTLSRSGNTYTGNITAYVYGWLDNNQGLVITASNSLNSVDLFAIKGANAVTNKPLLKLTYTKQN